MRDQDWGDTVSQGEEAALTQLRAWLAQGEVAKGDKLPAERELCTLLGVSRGELRKVLSVLEQEGALWRQVGKGTFVGLKPADEVTSLSAIAGRTSPGDVMRARLKFEPMLAAEAAVNATPANISDLQLCIRASRSAQTWREYETCDNRFHRTVAQSSGSEVLLALFDHLNALRRAVVWTRGRADRDRPPVDHHSFVEHDAVFAAISERRPVEAQNAMFRHLMSVQNQLVTRAEAAE